MPIADLHFSSFRHLLMKCQHHNISQPAVVYGHWTCHVYSCPPPAVWTLDNWTCKVSFHHQHYGRAGCLSTTSSMDVQGVSLPPAVWTCRVSFHHQPHACRVSLYHQMYARAGCLSNTSTDVQGLYPTPAVWTRRVSFHH